MTALWMGLGTLSPRFLRCPGCRKRLTFGPWDWWGIGATTVGTVISFPFLLLAGIRGVSLVMVAVLAIAVLLPFYLLGAVAALSSAPLELRDPDLNDFVLPDVGEEP